MESPKRKLDSGNEANETPTKKKDSSDNNETSLFEGFEISRVLYENSQRKMMCVEGRYLGKEDQKAVVILEKTPFKEEIARKMLTGEMESRTDIHNDIYRTCQLYPTSKLDSIKTTLIYPATEKHIRKYTSQDMYLIVETPEDYNNITLPYIETSFSIQWVFNILEKKQESERIVFEDEDAEKGFILLPDMKWNVEQLEDLYLVAIVHKRGIKSIRDLNETYLPLLNNIYTKGLEAIKMKYGIGANQLRIYVHYQPTYYHFHVHFTHLMYEAPGSGVEKAHLLTDVINNITLRNDFYQKSSLTFSRAETDALYLKFKDAGRI